MKDYIVVVRHLGDGCTYSCEDTFPVKAASVEDAFVAFDDALKAAKTKDESCFRLWGQVFWIRQAEEDPPRFMTVDDWCESGTKE